MTYVIHGATGAQGAPVLKRLVKSGQRVLAAVRNTAAVSGVPSIAVDDASVDSLLAAYKDASGVFIHLPIGLEEDRLRYAQTIAQAVAIAQPQRVVISTSGWVVDEPTSPLQNPPESAISTLIRKIQEADVSMAVVAPRLFLENLLLPVVVGPAKSEGVLRYPLRAGFPVSWSSHEDVADVAERLLIDTSVNGVVGVGQLPAITGAALAKGFANYLGRSMSFSSVEPEAFGGMITPLFGADAAAGVVAVYQAHALASSNAISEETSAQRLLNLNPRTLEQWLVLTGL